MSQFNVGDIVKINPDFITALKNRMIPGFSPTDGWLPEFLHKYCTYELQIKDINPAKMGNLTMMLKCHELFNDTHWEIDFTPDGRLFSATSAPPMIIRKELIVPERDPNFCSCGGETIYKPLFSSEYPACKDCGKEKKTMMIKIHDYSRGMEKIKHRAHLIQTENPHPQSLAAKMILNDQLRHQDTKYLERHDWEKWGEIRGNWLRKFRQDYPRYYGKPLRCMYCGVHLKYKTNRNTKLTIDHFFSTTFTHVNRFDTRFFIISCEACNDKKGHDIVALERLIHAPRGFVKRLKENIEQEFGVGYVSEESIRSINREIARAHGVDFT